jgi:ectoine hydroxylase-related dioxygenase (phytanoyl-CoA dioxygenase family)
VVWCKRAGGDDWSGRGFDQPLHMDYENNTLVVPDPADLDQLASITYYTDVTEDLGPTYVVSFQDSAGRHDANFHTRESAPDLYAHERPVAVSAGSILLYNMRTFHRGSAFRAADGIRVSHHVAYQRANCTWTSRNVPVLETAARVAALIPSLAPRQRTVLGFPAPGHPYWTPETIAAVERRYPGIDLSAYAVSGGAT